MSEERLQEIKDSIDLQYKVLEIAKAENVKVFVDEEQELVEEIERLKKELDTSLNAYNKKLKENIRLNNIINKAIDKLYCWGEILQPNFQKEMLKILKGEDKE